MSTVEESIDVAVPVTTAYNQWTQFESFPEFMNGVEAITQLTDTTNHWITKIGGVRREFDTEITEQQPDERIAWKSVDGTSHAGVVSFERLGGDSTRISVRLEWDPETFVEKVGAALGADDLQVKSDLKRFKEFIESRGSATGAWRGEVDDSGTGAAEAAAVLGAGAGAAGAGAGMAAGAGMGADTGMANDGEADAHESATEPATESVTAAGREDTTIPAADTTLRDPLLDVPGGDEPRLRDPDLGDRGLGDQDVRDSDLGDRGLGDRDPGDRTLGDPDLGDRRLSDPALAEPVLDDPTLDEPEAGTARSVAERPRFDK